MRTVGVLAFTGLLAALGNGQAVTPGCDYKQTLVEGQTYYVTNRDYPNHTTGRQICRWEAESGYRIRLTCTEFDMAFSYQCAGDHLSVQISLNEAKRYCGNQTFSVVSEGRTMNIGFSNGITSRSRFLCRLTAIPKVDYNENCGCGWSNPTRIVNGVDAGVNEFPMMAGLVEVGSASVYCGSTIISKKHVLTAAHCLANRNTSNIAVLTGEHDTSTGSDTNATRLHRVLAIRMHPDYVFGRDGNYADIGIVIIYGDIEFNMLVGPACLPFRHRQDSFAGSPAHIMGWGVLQTSAQRPTILQKARVNILVEEKCRTQYNQLQPGQICTDGGNSDSCQHDSGGPVLWPNPTTNRLTLIGIISYGDRFCGYGSYGVNTRVGDFLDWILLETSDVQYCGVE